LRLILSSELSGRNKLQAINALALQIIRYTAGIVHWPVNVLEELDRQTGKLLTIHRGLHPRSHVDRFSGVARLFAMPGQWMGNPPNLTAHIHILNSHGHRCNILKCVVHLLTL